jgi:hypothetical protein
VSGVLLPAVRLPLPVRSKLREFLQRGVGADVVVALQALIVDDEVVEESLAPGRCGVPVALECELVLGCAGDLPGLHHEFGALAHRESRARLDDPRQYRLEMLRAQRQPGREPLAESAAAIAREQELLVRPGIHDRRIAHRVHPAGKPGIDLAKCNLVP